MSSTDPVIMMNANFGNLSKVLASEQSLWRNRGYDTTNIFAVDNTARTPPTGTLGNFGGSTRFQFRKRGGRVHKAWLKVTVSAGVVAAANRAAFVDDLAANLLEKVTIEYSSKTMHEYSGEMVKHYNRLMFHDITRESYNAMAFAGLPPGAGGAEAQREALASNAFTVFVPLDWLWFTRSEDYSMTPEALASNLELVVQFRNLEQLIYARVTATGLTPAADPFTTRPIITDCQLYTQLIFTPHVEKTMHLGEFEKRQGHIYKILDREVQLAQPIAAAAGVYPIKLDNFRLDSQFLMFVVRTNTINTNYAIDRNTSDPTSTILPGGGSVAALQPIISFRLLANGSTIVDTCTDIENRAVWRSIYFPGSQIADYVYFIPWSWLLRDAKNVSGFQNMANLGTVELELTMAARTVGSVCDVYNICHNIIQKKKGDIIKALR